MNEDRRRDPEALLKLAQSEADTSGKLRIFLGMSAGVGKTYAMLEAARARLKESVNVVIGVVETHGRKETERLTQGIPTIAKKQISYRNVVLEEFNLEACLELKPAIALIDELAHTNAPGSRHTKRYQDVLELLDAGIDVYTTLNVQHLESRKDAVEQIVAAPIRETVPDSILERANQIELVDITPAELLQRLREGKVYLGEQASQAARNFFQEDRLTALREIALRLTAERVDHELQQYLEIKRPEGVWPTNERLLVAVSSDQHSETLIRATRRLAYNLEAPWIAITVNTGQNLNEKEQAQLAKNLALARELGAEVITTADDDIAAALRRTALQKNVTQLVIGRPTERSFIDMLRGRTVLNYLVRESRAFDIHVIRQGDEQREHKRGMRAFEFHSGFFPYWYTFWLFVAIAFLSGALNDLIGYRAIGYIFLLGVLIVGFFASRGPVLFAALLSAWIWNFFFIPPRFTFFIRDPADLIMCIIYFAVAATIGFLTNRIRKQQILIQEREDRTNILYEVLKDITTSREKSDLLERIADRMNHVLHGECGVLLSNNVGRLDSYMRYGTFSKSENELAVAQWVFDAEKIAGWGTDTLAEAKALYIPLRGNSEVVGVFSYRPKEKRKLSLDEETLLFSVCRQLGLTLERHVHDRRIREAEKMEESEKLSQTLLSSISHELRTPLTAIVGAATALSDTAAPLTHAFHRRVSAELQQASDRLNHVIDNLLDMSRLTSGRLELKIEWHDLHDLVGVALQKLQRDLSAYRVKVELPDDLPLVELDFRLMEHALSNLLINAATHTPPDSEIIVSAKVSRGRLQLGVEDSGPGVPEEAVPRLFDKFYRVPGTPAGGTGLGLSIVKSIVELHHGTVSFENRPEGGASFVLSIPLGDAPSAPKEADDENLDHR